MDLSTWILLYVPSPCSLVFSHGGQDPRASQNVTFSTFYWSNQSQGPPISRNRNSFYLCMWGAEWTYRQEKKCRGHFRDWLPYYMTGYNLKLQTKWMRTNHKQFQDLPHLCRHKKREASRHLMDMRTRELLNIQ